MILVRQVCSGRIEIRDTLPLIFLKCISQFNNFNRHLFFFHFLLFFFQSLNYVNSLHFTMVQNKHDFWKSVFSTRYDCNLQT